MKTARWVPVGTCTVFIKRKKLQEKSASSVFASQVTGEVSWVDGAIPKEQGVLLYARYRSFQDLML